MTRAPDANLSRVAFASLVAGLALLLVVVVWGGAVYPGYDHARQFISELGASGAVTGRIVSLWGFAPNGVLVTAFSLLAAWILRRSALAVVACLLLAGNGLGMTGAAVYPCDFECGHDDPSASALLHDLFGGLGYLSALLGVALAALWARKSDAPWLTWVGAVALVVSVVGFQGVVADVEFRGLYQRAMEVGLGVFMLALGWALMKGTRGVRA